MNTNIAWNFKDLKFSTLNDFLHPPLDFFSANENVLRTQSGNPLTAETDTFENGLLEALHSAALNGLENSNIESNTALFSDPSEFSDYSAIADVLLAIEQLSSPVIRNDNKDTVPSSNNLNINEINAALIPELVERLRLPPNVNTRLTPELTDAITNFVTGISDAVTTFIDEVQEAITANPLLGVLLALGLAALVAHFFRHNFFGKSHGGGYGPPKGGGGYHRRSDHDYDFQYRNFNDPKSEYFAERVISKLDNFENFLSDLNVYEENALKRLRSKYKLRNYNS